MIIFCQVIELWIIGLNKNSDNNKRNSDFVEFSFSDIYKIDNVTVIVKGKLQSSNLLPIIHLTRWQRNIFVKNECKTRK